MLTGTGDAKLNVDFQIEIVLADSIRLPFSGSGDFGTSPFLAARPGLPGPKAGNLTEDRAVNGAARSRQACAKRRGRMAGRVIK
jgi:hypothetical protein